MIVWQLDMDYCAYVACPAPPDIEGLVRSDNYDKSPDAIHNFTTVVSYFKRAGKYNFSFRMVIPN